MLHGVGGPDRGHSWGHWVSFPKHPAPVLETPSAEWEGSGGAGGRVAQGAGRAEKHREALSQLKAEPQLHAWDPAPSVSPVTQVQ